MASQRLLQNERRRTMMTFFGKLLPRILSKAALLAIATVLSDRNRELVAGIVHARTIGVLHALCVWRPCLYHNITQGLENPENFGKAHCGSEGSTVYDNILVTLNHIATRYETKAEAQLALAAIREYGRIHLIATRSDADNLFLDELDSRLEQWAFFSVLTVLTLEEVTPSAAEAEHSLMSRLKNGGMGFGTSDPLFRLNSPRGNLGKFGTKMTCSASI